VLTSISRLKTSRLKIAALSPFGIATLGLLLSAATWGHNLHTYAAYAGAAAIAAALTYLGWRKPRVLGCLLIAFVPLGAFLSLLGAAGVNSWAELGAVILVFCCIPLLSGIALIKAAG
jgi:hypothetical protein